MATGNMVCLYCRKKIGLLRSLKDRSFCCGDHRKKLTSKSARVIREAEDLFGFDESQVSYRVLTQVNPEGKPERRSGYGASIFFAVAVVFVLLALSQLRTSAPAGRPVSPEPSASLH